MVMVGMELIPLSSVPLGIWVIGLSGPLDGVVHTFLDSYHFHRLNVEVVLWDADVSSRSYKVLT